MAGPSKLTRWQHRVRDHSDLTSTQKAVALVLSTYMNKDSLKAWPSYETLGRGASVSEQTVRRSVRRLAVLGLIDHTPGRHTGSASTYTGRLEGINEAERAYQPRTERVSTRPKEPITGDTPTCEDLSEHVRTGPVASLPSGAHAPSGARSGPTSRRTGGDGGFLSGAELQELNILHKMRDELTAYIEAEQLPQGAEQHDRLVQYDLRISELTSKEQR